VPHFMLFNLRYLYEDFIGQKMKAEKLAILPC
jgi:hypothetical protein